MTIKINNPDGYDFKEFCEFVIQQLRTEVLAKIIFSKLTIRSEYLNSNKVFKFVGSERYISAISIIHLALNNFVVKDNKDHYIIEVNNNLKIYGTDNKVIDIVKLIEYGNQELPPYSLFRDVIDRLEIEELLKRYLEEDRL